MQKKIIALAVAGLVSGGAFAQSSVTISGNMKLSWDNVSAGNATAGVNATSRTRIVDNNSNIKFAGEEALGNGMKAFFFIESAIGTDNDVGTTGSNVGNPNKTTGIGTRDTAVGLSGNWGSVKMGKTSVHYSSMVNVESAGLADGLPLAASSLNVLSLVSGNVRLPNAISYNTPTMSGLSGQLTYSTGNGSLAEQTTAGMPNKENAWNLRLGYDNGPVNVAYSYYNSSNTGATPAGNWCLASSGAIAFSTAACAATTTAVGAAVALSNGTDVRSNRLGGAYSFSGFKLGLIWDSSKATAKTTGVQVKRTAWALPLSYTTGANKISFTYGKAGEQDGTAGKVSGSDAKMTMLGYEYSLSKRTSLSATYSKIDNGAAGAADFWHPSSNVGNVAAGADPRMVSFGMWHKF